MKTTLLILFITLGGHTVLGQNAEQRAKAYYFQAEEMFEDNQFGKALELLETSKENLGKTNASIEALMSKCFYELKDYIKAKEHLDNFYTYNPDSELEAEMSGILISINEKYEEQQKRELERRQAELKKQQEQMQAETALYQECVKYYDEENIRKYLDKYPDGMYVDQINARITEAAGQRQEHLRKLAENLPGYYEGYVQRKVGGSKTRFEAELTSSSSTEGNYFMYKKPDWPSIMDYISFQFNSSNYLFAKINEEEFTIKENGGLPLSKKKLKSLFFQAPCGHWLDAKKFYGYYRSNDQKNDRRNNGFLIKGRYVVDTIGNKIEFIESFIVAEEARWQYQLEVVDTYKQGGRKVWHLKVINQKKAIARASASMSRVFSEYPIKIARALPENIETTFRYISKVLPPLKEDLEFNYEMRNSNATMGTDFCTLSLKRAEGKISYYGYSTGKMTYDADSQFWQRFGEPNLFIKPED